MGLFFNPTDTKYFMRNKFIIISLLLFWESFIAQTVRYVYQTEINPDTINLVDMKVEKTFLDIQKDKSQFLSESKLLKDSLVAIVKSQESTDKKLKKNEKPDFPKLANGKSITPTFFDYFIIKDYQDKTVKLGENIAGKQIYYTEDRPIKWTLFQDFSDYKGYKTQKATTSFGGRIWTAWFSPTIKTADGPYKFSGLPGLILKLEDDRGDYRFSFLKSIKLPIAFSEEIKPDAKKSTRVNFHSDRVSMMMELAGSKHAGFDHANFSGSSQANPQRRGGHMQGGLPGQHMDGGRNRSMANDNTEGSTATSSNNNLQPYQTASDLGNSNPIELNKN